MGSYISATHLFGQVNCAEFTGILQLDKYTLDRGNMGAFVLGVSSLLVSPFASCFFLRVELLFPWGPQLNHLLREMRTGYNSCYCGFAETLKYLTGFSTP